MSIKVPPSGVNVRPPVSDAKPDAPPPANTSEPKAAKPTGFDASSTFGSIARGVGSYAEQSLRGIAKGTVNLAANVTINAPNTLANGLLSAVGSSYRFKTGVGMAPSTPVEKSWDNAIGLAPAIATGMGMAAAGAAALPSASSLMSRVPGLSRMMGAAQTGESAASAGSLAFKDLTAAQQTGMWSSMKRSLDTTLDKMGHGPVANFPKLQMTANADGSYAVQGTARHLIGEGPRKYGIDERFFEGTVHPGTGAANLTFRPFIPNVVTEGPWKMP